MDFNLFNKLKAALVAKSSKLQKAPPIAIQGGKSRQKPWLKYFFASLLAAVLLFVSNYEFIVKNIKYSLSPESFSSQPSVLEPNQKMVPNMLKVPSLDIVVPVVYVNENSEDKFQKALAYGVVHYPGTAMPGQPGNPYIFGHSSDFAWAKGKYKTIFALLPKIKPGAFIIISDAEGNAYRYEVVRAFVTEANDFSVLSQGDYKEKLLTLQTSYPVGTALRRFIVVSKLVE
jgi:sortase A